MKKYYTHNGTDQEGPFTLEELLTKKINSSTMIWYDGLENWKKAGEIEEIKSFVEILPPPFKKQGTLNETLNKTKKILQNDPIHEIENKIPDPSKKRTFKWVIVILSIIGLLAILSFLKKAFDKPDIEKSISVENQSGYVYFEPLYRHWNTHIGGYLVNKTRDYRFYDIKIEIKYLSKYNTPLLEREYIINRSVDPSKEINISTDIAGKAPEGSDKIEWEIIDASCEKVSTEN